MDNADFLIDILRQAGIRITPQRMAICAALANNRTHPTALTLYREIKDRYPSLSLTTVYNTLDILAGLGAVNILGNAGDGHIHYDSHTEPHINLACIRCHQIIDFGSSYIALLDQELIKTSGYHLLGVRMMYYGLCPACQKE